MDYKAQGLDNPQRRAEHAAAPDPAGERAQTLQRLQAAHKTYKRLSKQGRRRLQNVEQGMAPAKGEERPWLPLLNERERAEYDAARPDAISYMQQGLTDPQRRAEYRAEQDLTGERAQTLGRQQKAHQTYNRLSKLGRKRLRDAAQGHNGAGAIAAVDVARAAVAVVSHRV
jgi:hypothetical protein